MAATGLWHADNTQFKWKISVSVAAHAQGQGSAPYIKDGAAQEALGVPWSREFGTSGKYPKISSSGDPESKVGLLSVLLLAPHFRD